MGIFSLTTLSTMAEKAVKPYWQDVQVVEVNKEYPRTSFMTYNNRADALSGKFERSKYYRLLNGTWKFYFVDSYKKLPENITDPNTNTDSWDDIQVPGNWEIQGHGIAIYTNHGYEFKPRNPSPYTPMTALCDTNAFGSMSFINRKMIGDSLFLANTNIIFTSRPV